MKNLKIFEYQGSKIQFEEIDGKIMANATLMASVFNKKPVDVFKTKSWKEYEKAMCEAKKLRGEDIHIVNHGDNGGSWIHEELVIEFSRRLNPKFSIWCNDRISELIKNGPFRLNRCLLRLPSQWEKTFTDEFYSEALRMYNLAYVPDKNTPQFIGKFTNLYIYGALDKKLPSELKHRQEDAHTEKEIKVLMHQYLNTEAREVLKNHLNTVIIMMKLSSTIDQFKIKWDRLFDKKNQLEMYLR